LQRIFWLLETDWEVRIITHIVKQTNVHMLWQIWDVTEVLTHLNFASQRPTKNIDSHVLMYTRMIKN